MGGVVYTPYLPAQAGSSQASATTSSGGTSSSSSPDKISGTIKKEIIDLLKANGMPSDVQMLLTAADNFLSKSSALSNYSIFGGTDDDYSLSDLVKIQKLVNDVKYNDGLRKTAAQQITSENAGSEVAVNSKGQIYVKTNEGIKLVDPEDYEGGALTNDELLYYREQSPGLAFDTSILNDLQDTIGMKSITDYLRTTINAFGKEEIGSYTTKDEAVNRGLAALASGPDGFYKLKTSTQFKESDINAALDFLYNGLSKNAQHLLVATTAVEGGDPKSKVDTRRLILQALHFYPDNSFDPTFDKSATEYDPLQTGKKGGSSSETMVKDTYPEKLVSGDGLDPAQWINIMPSNTGVTLHAYAQNAGPVLRDEKNRMNNSNLQIVLSQGYGISGIADAQSITFGDQLINQNDYKRIMYDSSTNMKRVYLPVKYTVDGRITPNFEAQQKLEQVQSFIADNKGQVSDAWISNWLNENLPEARWNPETKQVEFDPQYIKPFLVLHGIAAKNRVTFDTDSNYLHHLSREEGRQWKEDYDRIVTEESVLGKLEHNDAKGAGPGKYYSGNIYIPISGPVIGATIYNDQYFPRETYTDITQKAEANQIRQQMKTNW